MKSLRGYVSLAAALLLTAIPSLAQVTQDRLFVTTADSVVAFNISGDGTLTAGPATTLGGTPLAIGSCPGKPFVFVVVNNGATNELRSYSVLADGNLTSNGTPAALGTAAASENLAVDPSCRFVYAISSTPPTPRVQLVTVNPDGLLGSATGQGVTPGANVGAVSPSGTYLHVLVSGDSGAYETYPIADGTWTLGSRSKVIPDSFDTVSELAFAAAGIDSIFSIFTYGQKSEGIVGYSLEGNGDLGSGPSSVGDASRLGAVVAHPSAAFVYAANSVGSNHSIRAYPVPLGAAVSEGSLTAPATDLVGYSSNGTTVLYAATADGITRLRVIEGLVTEAPSTTALAGATNLAIVTASVTPPGTLDVTVVIEKGSGTNCVNPKANGFLPTVIYGNAQVAANQIDLATLSLAGSSPRRCTLGDSDGDGRTDLRCTFPANEVTYPSDFTDCGTLPLTGKLIGGADIAGEATICLKKGATCSL